jgi:hypothetical protein
LVLQVVRKVGRIELAQARCQHQEFGLVHRPREVARRFVVAAVADFALACTRCVTFVEVAVLRNRRRGERSLGALIPV